MPESTDQPTPQPSTPTTQQPQESSIVREPATVENCQADYAAGAGARDAFDRNARRTAPNA